MAFPFTSPGKLVLLSAVMGIQISGNTPAWMDRKHGYVPKVAKSGNTKRRTKSRKK